MYIYKNSWIHYKTIENTITIYHKDHSHIIDQQTVNIYIHLYYGFNIFMIYNINTVITTAPNISRKHDTVKVALLLGGVPCPSSGVVCCLPPAGVCWWWCINSMWLYHCPKRCDILNYRGTINIIWKILKKR